MSAPSFRRVPATPRSPAIPLAPAALLEHLDVGIVACDATGAATLVTAPARALLDIAPFAEVASAMRQAHERLTTLDGASPPRDRLPLARALCGEVVDAEVLVLRHDAGQRVLWISARPVVDGDGTIVGAVATLREASHVPHPMLATDEQRARMGHELRTPLTAIRGALDLLVGPDASAVPPERRGLVDIVRRNLGTLLHVVNDLVDLERLESGQEAMAPAVTQVQSLVACAVEAAEAAAADAGVTIDATVPSAQVRVDADRIVQALTQLLLHAIARSPRGARVTITIAEDGQRASVRIVDHGAPVTAARGARAFARFEAADALGLATRIDSGLGLSLSRAIVARHGGRLTIASSGDAGTTFAFALPMIDRRSPGVRDTP